MKIYSITYASYFGDELFCDTEIYTEEEKFNEAYKNTVRDIAENIGDEEEQKEFLNKYLDGISNEVNWENWTREQMYQLKVRITEV